MANTNTSKHTKDPFKTRSWVGEGLTDPYQVLATSLPKLRCMSSAGW